MKIAIIHGQNHLGSTYHIARMLADKLAQREEIREFFLPRDLPHVCLGCYQCIEDDAKCPYYEEKRAITAALEGAELLIFATPNYCMGPTAQMKALLDLLFTFWMTHRPRAWMFEKKAVVISTTAGMGAGRAIKGVKSSLVNWGVPYVKSYGIGVQAKNWAGVKAEKKAKIQKDMEKLARKLGRVGRPRAGLKTRLIFAVMAGMHRAGWDSSPVERQYWEERGWLDKARPWKHRG